MKRAVILACLVIAVGAAGVRGAEPTTRAKPQAAPAAESPQPSQEPDQTQATEQQAPDVAEPVIPKREWVFEEKEEPYEIELFAADPEALQQRFVAIVRLDAYQALRSSRWRLSDPVQFVHSSLSGSSGVPEGLLYWLVKNAAPDRLPSPDLVEALTAHTRLHVRDYRRDVRGVPDESRPGSIKPKGTISFIVLAPTSERAKELTRAVITLLDYGFSFPMQRECLLRKGPEQERLATSRASLREVEAEVAGYEKQLEAFAEYEDVTQEALNGLITQQRLISVDLAGVRARIRACTNILADRDKLRPSQVDQVEQIKITAEIELVGLEARKAAIDLIVGKAAERRELSAKLTFARAKATSGENGVISIQKRIDEFESARRRYEPLPIEGEVIPVHPIKWISPEDPERAS
jgi:hypothetical protein